MTAPQSKSGLQRLLGFTVTCNDPAQVADEYCKLLGYRIFAAGEIDAATAGSWQAPLLHGRRFATVMPPAAADDSSFIRFVEQQRDRSLPRLGYGWNAIEVLCRDPYELAQRLAGSSFKVLIEPRPLPFDPDLHAMQVEGPAGELLYFTSLPTHKTLLDLQAARVDVDQPFIAILAGPDIEAMLSWYERELVTPTIAPSMVDVQIINDSFGLPQGSKVPLGIVKLPKRYLIEVDQHPPASRPRPRNAGELPPGIAMVSFESGLVPLGESQVRVGAAGEWLELCAPNTPNPA